MLSNPYSRPAFATLKARLEEPRRFIQIVAGPRQVGKTTLAHQVADALNQPTSFASADDPALKGAGWLRQQWDLARLQARESERGSVLFLDEVQKLPNWAEQIKQLWDADTAQQTPLRVVLLGSSPLLIERGLSETLAGRFELVRLTHWAFNEMREAFGWNLEKYLFFGGYPGAAPLVEDEPRWMAYINDALVETTVSRDILLMTRVDKPALLRRLFDLACLYSGRILSYQKMLGQLQDAGNTTTLAHYLRLLSGAGMVTGLQKYAGRQIRQRASSPKLNVLNTALMSARHGRTFAEVKQDSAAWGRLVESAVGAHLVNSAAGLGAEVYYWRDRRAEIDFVVERGNELIALEVKSSSKSSLGAGAAAFVNTFNPTRTLLVGGDGIGLETFFERPLEYWLSQ
ncbi:MAG TPA: ATP-binding protein [Gammaproteobacteria bacterium]|nr:ATP-binding protein [Gammaproteobacteria bacterium]